MFTCADIRCQNVQGVTRFSGRDSAGMVTVWITGVVLVQFTSDPDRHGSGFSASWISVPTQPSSLQNVICHFLLCVQHIDFLRVYADS